MSFLVLDEYFGFRSRTDSEVFFDIRKELSEREKGCVWCGPFSEEGYAHCINCGMKINVLEKMRARLHDSLSARAHLPHRLDASVQSSGFVDLNPFILHSAQRPTPLEVLRATPRGNPHPTSEKWRALEDLVPPSIASYGAAALGVPLRQNIPVDCGTAGRQTERSRSGNKRESPSELPTGGWLSKGLEEKLGD